MNCADAVERLSAAAVASHAGLNRTAVAGRSRRTRSSTLASKADPATGASAAALTAVRTCCSVRRRRAQASHASR